MSLYVGLDLGASARAANTGLCVLSSDGGVLRPAAHACESCAAFRVDPSDPLRALLPRLPAGESPFIAIDAPLAAPKDCSGHLTRPVERLFSCGQFARLHVNPISTRLLHRTAEAGTLLARQLEEEKRLALRRMRMLGPPAGGQANRGVIGPGKVSEVFPTLGVALLLSADTVRKAVNMPRSQPKIVRLLSCAGPLDSWLSPKLRCEVRPCPSENPHQQAAWACAVMAYMSSRAGLHDAVGEPEEPAFFLPAFRLWQSAWQREFRRAWSSRLSAGPHLLASFVPTA
jgi:hypothetical protein